MPTFNDNTLTGKSKEAHNKDIAKSLGLSDDVSTDTAGSEAQQTEPTGQQQADTGQPKQTKPETPKTEQQERDEMHTPTYRERKQEKYLDKKGGNTDINTQADAQSDSGDADSTGSEEPHQDGEPDPFDKYSRMANEQFKGDARRAAKSYAEAQREWMLERNKREALENEIKSLERAVQSDPDLLNRLKSAYRSLGDVGQQGTGQQSGQQQPAYNDPNQPAGQHLTHQQGNAQHGSTDVGRQSQPNTQNQNTPGVTEQELVTKGYLDPSQKGQVSPVEWREKVIDAKFSYMNSDEYMSQYAQRINQVSQQQYEQQQRQKQLLEDAHRIETENKRRITESYDQAVSELNLDLVEKPELLEKIKKEMQGFRDPDDGRLFRKDAFTMAARAVLESEGGIPSRSTPPPVQRQPQQKPREYDEGFNRRKSHSDTNPQSTDDRRPKSHRIWDEVDKAHKQVSRNKMRQNYTARPAPPRK